MINLVGNRRGRKRVRWVYTISLGVLISAAAALAAVGMYAAFTQQWNPMLMVIGPIAGFIATGFTLFVSWRSPIHQLPLLR